MRNIFIAISLLIFLSSSKCSHKEDGNYSFSFINNSDKGIYIQYNWHYPDTLWSCDPHQGSGIIDSHGGYSFELRGTWEDEFARMGKKGIDYLQLFVIDSLVYEMYSCDSIRTNNIISKRYQLDLNILEQKNWTITYP
ncbi:MAG: hypothetical protein WCU80_00005 [Paludibacteraceae bacterium]